MEELIISTFKFGLDTRKDVLTSQVGTLVACENCHINPGGEVEKRKAFDQFLNVAILDGNGAQGTFGLETVDVGLMVFGSALVFGTTPSQTQPVLASAMPTGVTYQQLKHPSLVNDSTENYNTLYHRMTEVKFSENFNGKAFVAAKFSDGRTFLYYDGTLIQQSSNGVVMEGRTALADLANDLVRNFEGIDWTAVANFNELGVAQNGAVIVQAPPLNSFTALPSETSAAGAFGVKFIAPSSEAVAGTRAQAAFGITTNGTVGVDTFTVTAPTTPTGTNYLDIAGGPVVALANSTLTAAAIAAGINDLTFIHGYTATSELANVTIYAPEEYGPTFTYNLSVAYTGTAVAGATVLPVPPLTVTMLQNPLTGSASTFNNNNIVVASSGIAISGGIAPYTIKWKEFITSGLIVLVGQDNLPTAVFQMTVVPFPTATTTRTRLFECSVIDNSVPPVQVKVFQTVSLTLTRL